MHAAEKMMSLQKSTFIPVKQSITTHTIQVLIVNLSIHLQSKASSEHCAGSRCEGRNRQELKIPDIVCSCVGQHDNMLF